MRAAGSADPLAVNRAMKALPVPYFGRPASIRSDGQVLFDLTLWRVKAPAEVVSRGIILRRCVSSRRRRLFRR